MWPGLESQSTSKNCCCFSIGGGSLQPVRHATRTPEPAPRGVAPCASAQGTLNTCGRALHRSAMVLDSISLFVKTQPGQERQIQLLGVGGCLSSLESMGSSGAGAEHALHIHLNGGKEVSIP